MKKVYLIKYDYRNDYEDVGEAENEITAYTTKELAKEALKEMMFHELTNQADYLRKLDIDSPKLTATIEISPTHFTIDNGEMYIDISIEEVEVHTERTNDRTT